MNRASLDVEDLLKLILVLVVIWLIFKIIGEVFDIVFGLFRMFPIAIGLLIVILIVLWLLDRI